MPEAVQSKWDDVKHAFAEYRPLFVLLDEIYRTVFTARLGLSEEDIGEIRGLIKEFVDLWKDLAPQLELTEPLKLHVLAEHVVDFTEKYLATPSCYGEQDGEASHRLFSQLLDTFKAIGKQRALEHSVTIFNACNF